MLGNEARNLLVNAYEKCRNAKYLATVFDVKERTVYRLVAQKRNTGSVELRTSERGRKAKLNEEQIQQIDKLLKQKPDITLLGIIEELDLDCSESTLSRAIHKLGYSLKKKVIHASEQERPRCEGKEREVAKIRL
ncbi:MAG: transposase [Selenomonadaceae bacterium]|nr:transposase [Selenomonadaceae bacterium]